jgi:hypothetical protein
MKFLDELWREKATQHSEPLIDLKVKFSNHDAAQLLLGYRYPNDPEHNTHALNELLTSHVRGWCEACVALRCTRGPVSGAIGWHFDGPYARETIHLALNNDSEYEGGRLCFFTPERGVEVLNRNAGDLTKHATETLHAVTRLTSGTRYSLFVVDRNNGLGDFLVVEPSLALTQSIMTVIQHQEAIVAAASSTSAPAPTATSASSVVLAPLPYQTNIPFVDLNIGDLLAQGAFKKVYNGTWTARPNETVCILEHAHYPLVDIEVMQSISRHPNLLHYYGCS